MQTTTPEAVGLSPQRLARLDAAMQRHVDEGRVAGLAVAIARRGRLAFQPGSRWCYGLSHDLLGYLIECVAGTTLDAFLKERVFLPLGMVDTGFRAPPDQLGRLAALYTCGPGGALARIDPPREGDFTQPCRFLSGGSGLVSTVGDYLRFAQMLLNRGELDGVRLLSRKTVELMTTDNLPPGVRMAFDGPVPGYGYGLGVGVRTGVAEARTLGSPGEFGWPGRAGTEFWVDPQEQMTGLIMPQLTPLVPASQFLGEEFKVLAYQAIAD